MLNFFSYTIIIFVAAIVVIDFYIIIIATTIMIIINIDQLHLKWNPYITSPYQYKHPWREKKANTLRPRSALFRECL